MTGEALIGRTGELATARRLVENARRGRGGALLVTGESGIGKTRLLDETVKRARDIGVTVLSGRAVESGGAYRAIAAALLAHLRDDSIADSPELRPYRAALGRLIPHWAAAADEPEPNVDPTLVLGEGLLRLLREIAGDHGVLLVQEDLHWADADTLAALDYLAVAVAGSRVLIAGSARDDEPSGFASSSLARNPGTTSVRLRRLTSAEIGALAAARACPLTDDQLRFVEAKTEGVPFLIEELLIAMRDAGDAVPERPLVPPTFADLVAGRLQRLSTAERAVLQAAAVIGDDIDWALLGTATGAADGVVADALRRAVTERLLDSDAGDLRWRHALTRDAVLSGLLAPERAGLALRAAQALLDRGATPQDDNLAADLLIAAGRADRACAILLSLARRDVSRGALRSAEALLARAAQTGAAGIEVAIERVRVLTFAGRLEEAMAAGERGLPSATGDAHAQLCFRLARTAIAAGRWNLVHDYLGRAGRPGDARSLVLAADAEFGNGHADRAAELARAAAGMAEERGDHDTLCEALCVIGRTSVLSDIGRARDAFSRAAQVASEHALVPRRVEALLGVGLMDLLAHDDDSTVIGCRDAAIGAGMLGLATGLDLIVTDNRATWEGYRAVEAEARALVEQCDRLALRSLQSAAELLLAACLMISGDREGAERLIASALNRPEASRELGPLAQCVRAWPAVLSHDLASAHALMDQAMASVVGHASAAPVAYWGLWVLVRTSIGDRDQAAREQLRNSPMALRSANRAALFYADAIALGRSGDRGNAARSFEAADALLASQHWWRRVLRLIALDCAVRDGWGDPIPALRADLVAHENAGDEMFARTCRDLLRRAGAPTRRGRGNAGVAPELRAKGVTSREMDVLRLIYEGLTNAEIANRLFLSTRTVETHVASLLAKTGAANRSELRRDRPSLTP